MGSSLLQETPTIQDLKLTIQSFSTLYPSEPTEKRIMFLSEIDQRFNANIDTVHFFSANPEFPSEAVIQKLRSAIERVLLPYDFMAGRLRLSEQGAEGRLEIDCNAAGVSFAVAVSELKLEEIGELDCPQPAFIDLALAAEIRPEKNLKMEDRPLCSFQLTFFKCGAFALGFSFNHTTMDGIGSRAFLDNIASVATGGSNRIATAPITDRYLLSARSPARVSFPHPELPDSFPLSPFPVDIEGKLLRLDAANVAELKRRAKPAACEPTSFKVVLAHIWRCKCLAEGSEPSSMSSVAYLMDIRARLQLPLPPAYTGNAVLFACVESTVGDLTKGSFWRTVDCVAEGAARMGDEYARSVIDCMFLRRGFLAADFYVSSWLRLGFADVEYPWGRPVYVSPAGEPIGLESVLLLPSIGGPEKGVNVLVALRRRVMERFTELFYEFLADP